MDELTTTLSTTNEKLAETQQTLELTLPHYDLKIGYHEISRVLTYETPGRIHLGNGRTSLVSIAVSNMAPPRGIGERRADDVSCLAKFPKGFNVSTPWTFGHRKVFTERFVLQSGTTIVSIDYGDDYALHSGMAFLFNVYVTPKVELKTDEENVYEIDVWADANNPHSKTSAAHRTLSIIVE